MESNDWRRVVIYDKKENVFVDLGDRYLVDHDANIFSIKNKIVMNHNVLKTGYHMIRLYGENAIYDKLVPNVVGWSFPEICGKYEPGLQTNHKDENLDNNSAENLEWCTASYNVSYGTGNERRMQTRENNGDVRRRRKVNQIKDSVIVKTWNSEIAAQNAGLGFDCGCISRCCHGILKQHKGYQWEFAD